MSDTPASRRIAVIGAGFSGVTAAWALRRRGFAVEIFEEKSRPGGLLTTEKSAVLVESAANAILANRYVEELLHDIGVVPLKAGHRSRRRWIYRGGRPRRLPLGWREAAGAAKNFLGARRRKELAPRAGETVAQWGRRCLNDAAVNYLLSPALQGIYAVGAEQLSAEVVIGGLLGRSEKIPRGRLRGSISAAGGMQEITDRLADWLRAQGVILHFSQTAKVEDLQKDFAAVIVATSHRRAAQVLAAAAPRTAAGLARVPAVSLNSCTLGFSESPLRGFGCLFPADQGFQSLGVLFNTDIFAGRGKGRSESWILPGEISTDEEVVKRALADRRKLTGREEAPGFQRVHRHTQTLPLYGTELRDFLGLLGADRRVTESAFPVYLTGNYLGAIGLGKILARNHHLAETIARELK